MSQMSRGKFVRRVVKISLKNFPVFQNIFKKNVTFFKGTFFKRTCCRCWIVFYRIVYFSQKRAAI